MVKEAAFAKWLRSKVRSPEDGVPWREMNFKK